MIGLIEVYLLAVGIVLFVLAWVAGAGLLAVLIGRMIRRRDEQISAEPATSPIHAIVGFAPGPPRPAGRTDTKELPRARP